MPQRILVYKRYTRFMHVDEPFSAWSGALYQGPLEEAPWQAFLAEVRELLGAQWRNMPSVAPLAGESTC